MALMKSGWLWRQSSILKRWKLNWCDLWVDGNLVFYKTDSRREYENRTSLKNQCVNVKSGLECTVYFPLLPTPVIYFYLFRHYPQCAVSGFLTAACRAWKLTLMEAKRNPVYVYNPYDDGYQFVPVDSHNAVYVSPTCAGGGGTHHILIHRDPCEGIGEQVALGLLAGMAAGAAMRSFMWMPFWFC
ncbi:pleckstrin homology domain-containing family B member 1 [Arapaima gigas]